MRHRNSCYEGMKKTGFFAVCAVARVAVKSLCVRRPPFAGCPAGLPHGVEARLLFAAPARLSRPGYLIEFRQIS